MPAYLKSHAICCLPEPMVIHAIWEMAYRMEGDAVLETAHSATGLRVCIPKRGVWIPAKNNLSVNFSYISQAVQTRSYMWLGYSNKLCILLSSLQHLHLPITLCLFPNTCPMLNAT